MKNGRLLLPLCLMLTAGAAQAQLYKWVGPDGKVTYSDTPPPSTATKVETKSIAGGGGVDTANFPYELAQATKNNPVILYTATPCPTCDEARKLLNTRGIPFTEKTVSTAEDTAALKKAGGDLRVPFAIIGRNKQTGFQSDAWNAALTAAGYPATNLLPKTYRNPEAQAAAPKPVEAPKVQKEPERPRDEALPPPIGNAPPDFHF